MTSTKLVQQLAPALIKAQSAVIALAVIYGLYTLNKMYRAGDKLAEQATAPLGQAWSDVAAWAGGYQPVELTSLVIQPWYLDDYNRISQDAWNVLYKAPEYQSLLNALFDDRFLKTKYTHLIGRPITKGDL